MSCTKEMSVLKKCIIMCSTLLPVGLLLVLFGCLIPGGATWFLRICVGAVGFVMSAAGVITGIFSIFEFLSPGSVR